MKVKKILACVLAFVILISAVPAVYAAGDDAGMSIFFDNNAPQAGDTITITLNVNRIFSDAAILETYLDFGEDVTYVKTEFLNVELNSRMIDSSRLHIYGWGDEDEEIAQKVKSIPTGAFARITFKISEYAAGKTLNFRLRGEFDDIDWDTLRFLYKGIIIKHNKTEPTYTKTSLFLCEKRRFFMARTEKGVVATI